MVYVDAAIWPWRGKKWCHMFADDLEELHAFAKKIGMRREWFQDKRIKHYDLTESRRTLALSMGAKAATLEDLKKFFLKKVVVET